MLDRIKEALEWLQSEQPEDAILSCHGILCYEDRFQLRVSPQGPETLKGKPTFRITVANPCTNAQRRLTNPILKKELEAFPKELIAVQPFRSGLESMLFTVEASISDSMRRAVGRYFEGCPAHKMIPCSSVGCRWLVDGHAKVLKPGGWR